LLKEQQKEEKVYKIQFKASVAWISEAQSGERNFRRKASLIRWSNYE